MLLNKKQDDGYRPKKSIMILINHRHELLDFIQNNNCSLPWKANGTSALQTTEHYKAGGTNSYGYLHVRATLQRGNAHPNSNKPTFKAAGPTSSFDA
jgi:hypothetical protein